MGIITPREAREELARRAMRRSFCAFFRGHEPGAPYLYGRHTRALFDVCQAASNSIRAGKCFYGIVNTPPRHGKSDIISRRYPVWHLGNNPDDEIILSSYSSDLAVKLAVDARNCFFEAAPVFGVRPGSTRANHWTVDGHKGALHAVGLGGSITGFGANILIIDDYLKNRQEAESETIRNKQWEGFISDLWTRLAPIHAVIIVATRWHEDDLTSRVLRQHEIDPRFPKFNLIRFKAEDDNGNYLFPERFPREWYEAQKALGAYSWNSLFQNDPSPRVGNLFKVKNVQIVDKISDGLRYSRGWDLASTEQERIKSDPDYTWGTKAAIHEGIIYVKNSIFGKWEAPERNRMMLKMALLDGKGVPVKIETVGGYKDCYTTVKKILRGKATVQKVGANRDKVAKLSPLEPFFEASHVVIERAPWNDEWLKQFTAFPSGTHDDAPDSLWAAIGDDPAVAEIDSGVSFDYL